MGDTRCTDMLGFLGDIGPPMFDEVTLSNVRASGVGLIHMTSAWPFMNWTDTLQMHRRVKADLTASDETFTLVTDKRDLETARAKNTIAVVLGLQDAAFVGERFDRLFDEGIRVMQIAYQQKGVHGSGFLVDADDDGLTDTGRKLVRAINRSGIILDLSHCAPKTTLDGLRRSSGPTMISHTVCRGVYNHPRGVDDDILDEIRRHGDAIVGVLAMTFFLASEDNGLDPMIRHIRYLAGRIGPRRVAVGTDAPVGGFTSPAAAEKMFRNVTQQMMDPSGELGSRWPTHIPDMVKDPHGFERLRRALTAHFTAGEIDGILGENGRRFFQHHLPQGDKPCTTY